MRVITFGCSFTKYHWPTWADIVLKQADFYGYDTDNWGCPGVGNTFIAIKVQEAIASGLLKAGDHAFICWSTFMREDRMVNGSWLAVGNIFNQHVYPYEFVEKFADVEFYALRDCALIQATKLALQACGITQTHMIMNTHEVYHNNKHSQFLFDTDKIKGIFEKFDLKFDCKPILQVLKQPDPGIPVKWSNVEYNDTHQMPIDMLRYVKQEMLGLSIPWLSNILPDVEHWIIEQQHKLDTTPRPVSGQTFSLPNSKYRNIGL
jgi:hypothetical protein